MADKETKKAQKEREKEEARVAKMKLKEDELQRLLEIQKKAKEDKERDRLAKKEAIDKEKAEAKIQKAEEKQAKEKKAEEDRIKKEHKKEQDRLAKDQAIENEKKKKADMKVKLDEELSDENNKTYCRMKEEFELTHAKIVFDSVFVCETGNKVIIMRKESLITSYEHMTIGKDKHGNKILFIYEWLKDDDIRVYNDMDIYPTASLCPPTTYNMWRPFAMEEPMNYIPDIVGRDFILNHYKIMCNNDETMTNFVIRWNAHMFQYPENKSFAITFTGEEGTGKSSVLEINKVLMGQDKVFETANPKQYIFGDFNGCMQDAFLVGINEAEKADSKEFNSKMKDLITAPTTWINNKGQKPIKTRSYHRIMTTSNTNDSTITAVGDRRNGITRVSPEKKGDVEYFNQLYEYINNKDTMKTLYDYFMAMEGLENFHKEKVPLTEHQQLLQQSARTQPDHWLEAFTIANKDKEQVVLSSKAVFEQFNQWKEENNVDYNVSSIKFGVQLKMLKMRDAIQLEPVGRRDKIFNIKMLKEYYKIVDDTVCQIIL
jgi:hypothetical protein